MRNFVLQIKLSFLAETEALAILDACKDVVQGISYEREAKLIQTFTEQAETSVAEIKQIIDNATMQRPQVKQLIDEADKNIAQVRQYRVECEDALHKLQERARDLMNQIDNGAKEIQSKLDKAQVMVVEAVGKLHELDELIKQAQQRSDACLFINDMARVNRSIMTSGQVTLLGKDDLGNFAVRQSWQS
mgnify:CR=1 FL=1